MENHMMIMASLYLNKKKNNAKIEKKSTKKEKHLFLFDKI